MAYANTVTVLHEVIRPGYDQNLDTLQPVDYRVSMPQMTGLSKEFRDFDALWPRSSFPGQNTPNGFQNGIGDGAHQAWEWNWPPTGCHVPKVVSGIVKDFERQSGCRCDRAAVQYCDRPPGGYPDVGCRRNVPMRRPERGELLCCGISLGQSRHGRNDGGHADRDVAHDRRLPASRRGVTQRYQAPRSDRWAIEDGVFR